jgi:hypothetical protein
LTERFSEKYIKKLFGNGTDIEDALKRLDILTQQETQMSAAQVLRATHTVDDAGRVRGVADIALGVSVQVQDVDDKLVAIIGGAQYIFNQSSEFVQHLTRPDGKEARGAIQQSADGVDRIERLWFPTAFILDIQAQSS